MKLFIIGFMGSGKTFLGRQLALKLNEPFYDMDIEIEKQQHLKIKEIFKQKGEPFFRELESKLLLNWDNEGIIATGGGVVESNINREFLLSEDKIVVWLNPVWTRILKHLERSEKRPLYNDLDNGIS